MKAVQIVSLHKVETLLKMRPFDETSIKKAIPSFFLVNAPNEKYVKPNFSEIEGRIKGGILPKVILVSAAGATGKSELTKYLSSSLKIPVFDLSKHDPVASNSLTGLFFETLGPIGLGKFVEELTTGNGGLIIDALDEGHLKTKTEGFNAFLDGIVSICKDASNTSFILLGRTQVIEHSWLYFEEKGIDSSLLKIEPFTTEQAVEFIDKQIGETNYDKQYREVRDYIINSVEGFFKSTSAISKKEYQSFIGYAPVLQSITTLLKKTKNYKSLYEELAKKNDKGIDLILSIVEYILIRDKEEKIKPLLLESLLKGRPQDFSDLVNHSAYSIEEQCARILSSQISQPIVFTLTNDTAFNHQYEEKIAEWLKEHPFVQDGNIQNAVFECYILAKLMQNPKYNTSICEYLRNKYKDAFMLFFIFDKLSESRKIDNQYLQYLLASIKSLDDSRVFSTMHIENESDEDDVSDVTTCEVEFSINSSETVKYSFNLSIEKNEHLYLGDFLSNISVNAPINIVLNGKRSVLSPVVSILCSKITINTSEFVVEKGMQNLEGIHFECDEFFIDYSGGQVPVLINHLDDNQKFSIFSNHRPDFPFGDYLVDSGISKLDPLLIEKYLRLRKILMLFRSHSKGVMAKYRDKIEHKRVLRNEMGEKVLELLVKSKVLYHDTTFYYWEPDVAHEQLGITYLDLKRKIINQKTIDFLNKI